MLPELKLVFKLIGAATLGGVLLGVLIGAITESYLLWIGLTAGVGAGFGLALAYGFLPER